MVASGTALGVVAVVASAVGLLANPDSTTPDIADRPANVLIERAPEAGAVDEHWPIELGYVQQSREFRFRGTSWADWSVDLKVGEDSWRLVDREHPGEQYESEGAGAFLDEQTPDDDQDEGFVRAPGPHLISFWRDATGLGDRTVVELDAIPGGVDLVEQIGLRSDEVEAYVTPNLVGCDGTVDECLPAGETGARGIAHLPTGFPLFAEEDYSGEGSDVWLEARSIRWADQTIAPVAADEIPRMSDHAAADAQHAAETATDHQGSLIDGTFELGDGHLWSGNGHASRVATRFVDEVLGWPDVQPVNLAGDLTELATVTVRAPDMREVTIHLEALDQSDRYGITALDGLPGPELQVAEDRQLRWPPSIPREVAAGVALVRTPDDGTVRIDLDQEATANGSLALDDHLTSEQSSCPRVQAAIIAILDEQERITDVTGTHWRGTQPDACP